MTGGVQVCRHFIDTNIVMPEILNNVFFSFCFYELVNVRRALCK